MKFYFLSHLVKRVLIRSFSGQYFLALGLNTGKNGSDKFRIRAILKQYVMHFCQEYMDVM